MATVLVVDDEYGIAELLEAVLVDEDHRVLTASNGRHGLKILDEERPDVIFLDYRCPSLDGAAMLSQLTARAALRDTPVVMLSSIAEATVAARCTRYVLFLRKPFNVFHVIEVVNDLTGGAAGPSGAPRADA